MVQMLKNFLFIFLFCLFSCTDIFRHVQYWGEEERMLKKKNLEEEDQKKWEKQLEISQDKIKEAHEAIEKIAVTSELQLQLSRKIAKRYMKSRRYDLASVYYKGALEKKIPKLSEDTVNSYNALEKSLVYFDKALLLSATDIDLLWEASLAYANASVAQGWEEKRFLIALQLLKKIRQIDSEDVRPLFQMALLYGKTNIESYRNRKYAIQLLKVFLQKKEENIKARFALAYFLVQENQNQEAIIEYQKIISTLEEMYQKKIIKGALSSHSIYQRARENLKKLERCENNPKACNF